MNRKYLVISEDLQAELKEGDMNFGIFEEVYVCHALVGVQWRIVNKKQLESFKLLDRTLKLQTAMTEAETLKLLNS